MALVAMTGEPLWRIKAHDRNITALAISPDGEQIATAGNQKDPGLKLWDLRFGSLKNSVTGIKAGIFDLIFDARGATIIAAGHEGVRYWDSVSGEPRKGLSYSTRPISSVALTHDGLLATGGFDRLTSVWDISTGHRLDKITASRDYVRAVAFIPEGQQLIAAGDDGAVRLFNLENAREMQRRLDTFSWFRPAWMSLSADGSTLVSVSAMLPGHFSGSADGELTVWEVRSGERRWRIPIDERDTMDPAISPDGRLVATCGQGTLRLWDVNSQVVSRILHDQAEFDFIDTAFSPDGHWLAGVARKLFSKPYNNVLLSIWDLTTEPPRRENVTLRAPLTDFNAWLAFDDASQHLTVAHSDAESGVVDVLRQVEDQWHATHSISFENTVTGTHFVPRSSRFVAATWDGHVTMHDIGSPEPIWRARPSDTFALSMTSDGRILATGHNLAIGLWDIETADQFATIETNIWVSSLVFTPDGRTLIWGGGDGSVHFERTEEVRKDITSPIASDLK
jgi:WD40 repeat protein